MLCKALVIVDVQNDFCPGGTLAVPDGDKIIPALNRYTNFFIKKKLPIFATRDWHPKVTEHFQEFGGVWPPHCIQKTKGAQFHPKLKLPKTAIVISKGMDPDKDSYSAFQAVDADGELFENILERLDIDEIYIGGLATDYCVKATCLDALRAKYRVNILLDAIKGVDLMAGDSTRALDEMFRRGAKKFTAKKLHSN